MGPILPILVVLLVVAFVTRAEAFFYLLYALTGIYVLGRSWARRALGAVSVERHHDRRAFLGQTLPVEMVVHNRGWLPVLWMRLGDTIPAELSGGQAFRQVISLGPRERLSLHYELSGRRRGYYPVGPVTTLGGDLLGSATYEDQQAGDDYVIVYPRIVTLREMRVPSQSPFGTLPSRERIFEDPSRIQGVRAYQPGDPLRRIDWKTSARLASLQVRRYEPAIARDTAVYLNLDGGDYPWPHRLAGTELAIVIAASVAVHMAGKRQAVGLATNGVDPLAGQSPQGVEIEGGARQLGGNGKLAGGREPATVGATPSLPLRKGSRPLMHLLDLLARIAMAPEGEAVPFLELVSRRSLGLPWGSTVVVITAAETEGLMDTLLGLRRRGLAVILVLTCTQHGREFEMAAERAGQIGVPAFRIESEPDLDVWQ